MYKKIILCSFSEERGIVLTVILINCPPTNAPFSFFDGVETENTYYFESCDNLPAFGFLKSEEVRIYCFCDDEEQVTQNILRLKWLAPYASVIIVGQREEYKSARSAFLAGADDYIAAASIGEHIRTRRKQRNQLQEISPLHYESIHDFNQQKSQFLDNLISGNTNTTFYASMVNQLHLERYTHFSLALLSIDVTAADVSDGEFEEQNRVLNEILYCYLREYANLHLTDSRVLYCHHKNLSCLMCYADGEQPPAWHEQFMALFEHMLEDFQRQTAHAFSMSISPVYNDYFLSKQAFQQAGATLEQRFYMGCGQIYFDPPTFRPNTSISPEVSRSLEKYISAALDSENHDMLELCCKDFIHFLRHYRLNQENVQAILGNLANNLISINNPKHFELNIPHAEFWNNIQTMRQLCIFDQLSSYFFSHIITHILPQSSDTYSADELQRVLQIIDSSYQEKITLKSLSDGQMHFNSSYFSVWFKQKVGMNFSEYLVRKRLEAAKSMLQYTNKSIQQISIEVGYDAAVSFNRAFKKYYGTTPSNFRKQYLTQKPETGKELPARSSKAP